MADAAHIPDEAETRARWGNFAWTAENAEQAKKIIARYPERMSLEDLLSRDGLSFATWPRKSTR